MSLDTPANRDETGGATARSDVAAPFPIVGIGASAGGLEALERLLRAVPVDAGMALVVVQHLSPDFDSVMDELLLRQTDLPVHTASDGMQVRPRAIYLLPPKKEMIISDGKLLLTDKDPRQGRSLPIDTFFRSLAQDAGSRAVAVVLSGTGSDGSRGIRDVHQAGGLVMAQSEETAKFAGMPRSAVETGVVDLTLSPEEMASALLQFARNPVIGELALAAAKAPVDEGGSMNRLLRLLREAHGIDFSLYKPSTVSRRIQRRLLLNQSVGLEQYVSQLAEDPDELNSLYRDLLVGATRFFRDPEAFELLETRVISELLSGAEPHREIRVWAAGCATGEEVYSLAILLHERLTAAGRPLNVKIFATDVNRRSLDFAAQGLYPEGSLENLSAERRERHFSRRGDQCQVSPMLRQMVVFAQHNLIKDAPFTRMDLISCRNLLIYLRPAAQKKVISLLHFGLRKGGALFLGPSEGVGEWGDEFDEVDRPWRVYRKRRDVRLGADIRLPLSGGVATPAGPGRNREPRPAAEDEQAARIELVRQFAPPAALINERREILHLFNQAGEFLLLQDGRRTSDILDHCPPDLKTVVACAIQRAARSRQQVLFAGVRVDGPQGPRSIRLGATPLSVGAAGQRRLLISFQPLAPPAHQEAGEAGEAGSDGRDGGLEAGQAGSLSRARILSLETDLQQTRANLQATIEELQSTNEELVASNEELQSTNEELHSVNEELYTVNAEYQRKIGELTRLGEDMDNLLESTDVGVIFLDERLRIRKFTPHMSRLFNIVGADVGRAFDNFTHHIQHDGLMDDVRQVQAAGAGVEREVRDRTGTWHLLRIVPYRSKSGSQGVVVTLIDVQQLKAAEEELRRQGRERQAILDNSPAFIFIKDLAGCYTVASGFADKHLGARSERIVGHSDHDLLPQEAADMMEAQDRRVATTGESSEVELQFQRDGAPHRVLSTKYPLRDENGHVVAVAGMWTDTLQRARAEESARQALQHRDRFLAMLSHELRNPTAAMHSAVQLVGRSANDPPTVRRAADVLRRQLEQTKRLLDDLLDLSRSSCGDIELRKQVVDLREVLNDAVLATRSRLTAHELKLGIELPGKEIRVYGDPARLQQVVVNLLVNAAKYTPSGGDVSLTLRRERNRAVVAVADTGVGMSDELQQRVFEPFVQADETLDRSEGGVGLGLTLVKSLAESHGGEVSARSLGEGQGSTFSVSLPITRRSAKRAESSSFPQQPEPAADPHGDLTLLLVEDNEDAREMLTLLLEAYGYQVDTACDGRAALQAIETQRPDVALVDIGLPEMDGYQVARQVRKSLGRADIKLVALTGYGQQSDRKKARRAGFDAHLTKPVDIHALHEFLQAAAAEAAATRAAKS